MKTKPFGDFTEEPAADETGNGIAETPAPGAVDGARPDPAAGEYTAAIDAALDTMRDSAVASGGGDRVPGDRNDAGAGSADGAGIQAPERPRDRAQEGEALARSFLELIERAADGKITNADGKPSEEQKNAFCKAAGRVIEKRVGGVIPWEDEIVLIGLGLVVLLDPIKKLIDRMKERRGAA
jgi:hypothetical protein